MSRVNLLPPELRELQAIRRRTALVALGGVALLALLGVFYFIQTGKLSSEQSDLDAARASSAIIQAQISELQPYADLQQQLEAKKQLKDTLFQNEISWSGVLIDVSRVIPDTAYLTSFTATVTAPTGTVIGAPATPAPAGSAPSTSLIGSMSFAGVAKQTETISSWLTRLEQVDGWVNPWVNSAQEQSADTGIYIFGGGVDMTTDAATVRGRGGRQ
jgi:Tfp pilus assembly protein PilN